MPFDAPIQTQWLPVGGAQSPTPGDRVAVYNGVRVWVTKWNEGLLHRYARYPATHYTRDITGYRHLPLPYAPVADDDVRYSVREPKTARRRGVRHA